MAATERREEGIGRKVTNASRTRPRQPSARGPVAFFFGLALLAAACERGPKIVALPPPEVAVSHPELREMSEFFTTTGRTAAVEKVEIRARVSGYLVKVDFTDGDDVTAGQVLFEIDPRPYEAAVLSAEGARARWQAALAKAKSDVERLSRLAPRGAASAADVEGAIANRDTALAEIKSASAALENAKLNLEFTRVRSPIGGRVSRAELTVGNLVEAGAGGSPPLTTVVSVSPVYVYFDVDEATLLRARTESRRDVEPSHVKDANIPVEIGLTGQDGYPLRGVLDFVDNRVDPSTGTIKVRAVLDNPGQVLSPGMFVRVRLPIERPAPRVLVNARAIGTDQGAKYVLVVNDHDVVEQRRVVLGPTADDGLRVVREGLAPDDWVIVSGLQRVRPGQTVRPRPMASAPAAAG